VIRRLAPGDRAAVREIACRTAFRNMGSDALFEDRELHADYWTSYYTDHRPGESWVVEQDGEVIGYFLGCSDQADFLRVMSRRIVPRIIALALWRLATGRYRNPRTRRYLWHMLTRGAREAPRIDFATYPAHYHCNILRPGYGQRYYSEMLLMFLDHLEAIGVDRLHGFITEPAEGGIWQRFSAQFPGGAAEVTAEVPTTLFRRVMGDDRPMVNRGWGVTVPVFRAYALWLRETYNL
jgi:hypothetical protein